MEFQAIVCCGKGKNLSPFSAVRQNGTAKALLPVANKPMIHYSLEWCDKAPFNSVLVVTDVATKGPIEEYVNKYKQNRSKEIVSQLEVVGLDIEGTANIIKALADQEKITKDFILLSCDFITDLPPQILIEQYRNKGANDIGMCVYYKNSFVNIDEKKSNLKRFYTCYSTDNHGENHLLDVYSKASVEKSKFLNFRTQMVWRHSKAKVSSKLLDSFIYFCSHEILDILSQDEYDFEYKSCTKIMRDLARRSWKHSTEKQSINMFILPDQCTFARADNLTVYLEANRWVMQQVHMENIKKVQTGQQQALGGAKKDKNSPTIGPESQTGENTTVDEKTNVKKSLIGSNCKIGKRCRLVGSIILDNVVIQDDVFLENCIIGKNVNIDSKAKLINCNVENNYNISKGSQIKGETLLQISLSGLNESSTNGLSAVISEEEESDEDETGESDDGSEFYVDDFDDDLDGEDLFER